MSRRLLRQRAVGYVESATSVRELVGSDSLQVMRALEAEEIIDSSFMNVAKLKEYLETEISDGHGHHALAPPRGHMMKISDPIIFGHVVKIFYKDVFESRRDLKRSRQPEQRCQRRLRQDHSLDAGSGRTGKSETVYGNTRPNIGTSTPGHHQPSCQRCHH